MAEDLVDSPDIDATIAAPEGTKEQISVSDAARILARARNAQQQSPEQSQDESAPPSRRPQDEAAAAPPEPESADDADANPPEEDHGEPPEAEAAEPPIDPPVSWTTEAKEHWRSLPRETQEYVAQREQERERLLTRSQTEAKEQQKTLESERLKLEQARSQYEQALPALVEALQQSIASDFPDIKAPADWENLARTDWARYIAWDASQKKLAAVANEARAAQERQTHELQNRFQAFAAEQDKLFMQHAPEFADKDKAAALQRSAINVLKDIGFTDEELARQWAGQEALSLRDHRLQLLIRDGVRYREAQSAMKKAVAKPVPPVQRPGVSPLAPGRSVQTQIQAIQKQMARTTSSNASAELGAQLLALQRQAARQGR